MPEEFDFSELRNYLQGQMDMGDSEIFLDEPWTLNAKKPRPNAAPRPVETPQAAAARTFAGGGMSGSPSVRSITSPPIVFAMSKSLRGSEGAMPSARCVSFIYFASTFSHPSKPPALSGRSAGSNIGSRPAEHWAM